MTPPPALPTRLHLPPKATNRQKTNNLLLDAKSPQPRAFLSPYIPVSQYMRLQTLAIGNDLVTIKAVCTVSVRNHMKSARKMDVNYANCRHWQRNLMCTASDKHRSQR